jgi:quinol monooxygenase YgiN
MTPEKLRTMHLLRALATLACIARVITLEAQAEPRPASIVSAPHTVLELRQYTLHPGNRDVLIDIFERNFVEGQEAQGMWIVGQFRDLDNPDRFVWLRSFADMAARATALNGFYSGPVWQSHREAANPTMVDSDNVLLLRPARAGTSFPVVTATLPPRDARGAGKGLVVASIVYLRSTAPGQFVDFFEKELKPEWEKAGARVVAELVSETSANNFPRLPVREGERVFVWFATYEDQAAYDKQRRALSATPTWRVISGKLSLWTHQPIENLRLEPTARSRLHGG